MPSHALERPSNGRNKKDRQLQSPGGARVDIPPPHLHAHSQLYYHGQSAGANELQPASHTGNGQSYDDFVHHQTHSIKFTRKNEACTPTNCIFFFIAFLFSFMAIMSGIFYGLNFFDGKHIKERVFKVQFAIFDQELAAANIENVESDKFKSVASTMKQRLEQLFRESSLDRSYIKTELVALERRPNRASEVMVHLNVHVTANKRTVDSSEIYLILAEELANNRLKLFEKWAIDHNSLDVQERKWTPREKSALLMNPWTYKSIFPGMLEGLSTEPTPAPRKCMNLGVSYCRFLSYNRTSYPNPLNHWNLSSIEEDFHIYKEIIDSECYSLSKEFLCTLLQPECIDDEVVLPCKSFCVEFFAACQHWLPERVASKIVCGTFPDARTTTLDAPHSKSMACREKPNCAAILRLHSERHKLCDGVRDCQPEERGNDESGCSYCKDDQFHCGNQQCVPREAVCDGVKDCRATSADEQHCFRLLPSTDLARKEDHASEGFLMATFKGRDSFVCSESALTNMQNYSHVYYNNQLQILGLNICNERHFEELIHIESKHVSLNGPFSKFVPGTTLISPYSSQCRNREIYYVECAIAKCGVSAAHAEQDAAPFESRKAFSGYWPWFGKINFNHNYICDGTLVSHDTLLAQATCFSQEHSLLQQSQNLSVTLGSVRFYRDNIEAQKFQVSSVTPLSLPGLEQKQHLVRLIVPVNVTRTIRPICHTADSLSVVTNLSSLHCVLLTNNYETDRLQSRVVNIVSLEQCAHHLNLTLPSGTEPSGPGAKLCVEVGVGWSGECASGECGGRHLYCLYKFTWHLLGVEWSGVRQWPPDARHLLLFDSLTRLAL